MLLTEPGAVKETRLPARSLMVLSGESFFTSQTWSATVCAPAATMTSFCPALMACTAAARDTSPNGMPPASVLRTAVPPPAAVRMPVTSTPCCLKKPFFMATA